MNVSWAQTPGSDEYTAWAIGTDGRRLSCNSTSSSCSIHGLQCGQIYEVALTSSAMGCDISAGSDYKVHAGRCRSFRKGWPSKFISPLQENTVFLLVQLPVNPRTPPWSKTAAATTP